MISKLKGLLGFCQCCKCWNRSFATVNIKSIDKTVVICMKHAKEITKNAKLMGVRIVDYKL